MPIPFEEDFRTVIEKEKMVRLAAKQVQKPKTNPVDQEVERVKSEFLDQHRECFYPMDTILQLAKVPEEYRSGVKNKFQTGAHKWGIKKISSSSKAFYGVSELCPVYVGREGEETRFNCYRDWCSGRVMKYGSCEAACPRKDDKERPEFIDK